MSNSNKDNTIADLRTILFDTIDAVKNGTMDTKKAQVISDLSRNLLQSAAIEVQMVRVGGGRGKFVPIENDLPPVKPQKRLAGEYSNPTSAALKIANGK